MLIKIGGGRTAGYYKGIAERQRREADDAMDQRRIAFTEEQKKEKVLNDRRAEQERQDKLNGTFAAESYGDLIEDTIKNRRASQDSIRRFNSQGKYKDIQDAKVFYDEKGNYGGVEITHNDGKKYRINPAGTSWSLAQHKANKEKENALRFKNDENSRQNRETNVREGLLAQNREKLELQNKYNTDRLELQDKLKSQENEIKGLVGSVRQKQGELEQERKSKATAEQERKNRAAEQEKIISDITPEGIMMELETKGYDTSNFYTTNDKGKKELTPEAKGLAGNIRTALRSNPDVDIQDVVSGIANRNSIRNYYNTPDEDFEKYRSDKLNVDKGDAAKEGLIGWRTSAKDRVEKFRKENPVKSKVYDRLYEGAKSLISSGKVSSDEVATLMKSPQGRRIIAENYDDKTKVAMIRKLLDGNKEYASN